MGKLTWPSKLSDVKARCTPAGCMPKGEPGSGSSLVKVGVGVGVGVGVRVRVRVGVGVGVRVRVRVRLGEQPRTQLTRPVQGEAHTCEEQT